MAPTLSRANFHVFVHDGEVLSSPNRSFLPPIPSRYDAIPTTPSAKDALQTYWADHRYPTQPFTPLAPRLDIEPYRSLKITDDRIIVKVGTHWRLKPSLMNSWKVIENHLLFISNTLFNRSSMMLPLETLTFPPPSKYGYTRNHMNRKSGFISASNSRDAFFSLMGWCSYTIFIFHGPGLRPWKWERILLENKFPASAIQQLAESELLDFSSEYKRAGVFVDSHCKMLPLIPSMIRANIPLWIHWGSLNEPGPLISNLSQYRPNIAEINQAPKTFSPQPIIRPTNSPIFSAVDLETASSEVVLPKPERNSRQKHGEKWQAFFIRMAERNARVEARESSDAKRARLTREAKEKDHQRPAKSSKGPAVFRWEIDAASNFRMRKLMSKREVDEEWSNYTNTQRRYDGFHNEWDICTEFDPDAYATNDEEDDDSDCFYGNEYDVLNPSSVHLQRGALDVEPPVYMSTSHDEQIIDGPFSLSFADTISDMAFERYGFVDPGNMALESIPDDKEWKTVLRTFCKVSSKGDNRVRAAIKQFLNNLLEAKPNGFLSDLSADAVHPLSEHANPSFRLSPHRVYLQSGEMVSVYLIEPRAADHYDVCWQLLVNDAATALECMRGCHRTLSAIVRFMVQSGRVFRTCSPFNILQGRAEPRRWHRGFSLGWRELANKPQASEYTSYERLRAEFFRQPHARAALMKGGIVWRLALEHVQGLAEELVLEGPSDEVLTRGTCWRLTEHSHSDSLWDDDLSSDELDFICGVYKLYTSGKFQTYFYCRSNFLLILLCLDVGRNTADVSWWPKYSTFISSGLNVGHWTDACEEWFQMRHLQIVEGRAELKTATQWFNSLKYEKNTKRLMKRNIEEAEAYLKGQRSTPLKL